jgi:hypothetical protein
MMQHSNMIDIPRNMLCQETKRPLCRFFVMGRCKFGETCTFSHDLDSVGGINEAKKNIICPFFLKGKCRHRENCYFSHELQHVDKEETQTQQTDQETHAADTTDGCESLSLESSAISALSLEHDEEENYDEVCGVCQCNVIEEGQRFALYQNCEHCFCNECAKGWHQTQRATQKMRGVDVNHTWLKHACPICRIESDHIIPSKYFYKGDEKATYVREYKEERSKRNCKFFKIGQLGTCPFGPNCFYAHMDEDGKDMKPLDVALPKSPTMYRNCRPQ